MSRPSQLCHAPRLWLLATDSSILQQTTAFCLGGSAAKTARNGQKWGRLPCVGRQSDYCAQRAQCASARARPAVPDQRVIASSRAREPGHAFNNQFRPSSGLIVVQPADWQARLKRACCSSCSTARLTKPLCHSLHDPYLSDSSPIACFTHLVLRCSFLVARLSRTQFLCVFFVYISLLLGFPSVVSSGSSFSTSAMHPKIAKVITPDSCATDSLRAHNQTVSSVHGLLRRLIPAHVDLFALLLVAPGSPDYFRIKVSDGKVHIDGTSCVELASGVHW